MTPRRKVEFGDFQTPPALANAVVHFLRENGVSPDVVVEPTCGVGSFIQAACDAFPGLTDIYGFDICPKYVAQAAQESASGKATRISIETRNFFDLDWADFLSGHKGGLLLLGNPPWVTNSTLGGMDGSNLPPKSNVHGLRGFAAKTGKSNFDISEWMLLRLLLTLASRKADMAMLCKTTVARKIIRYAWTHGLPITHASLHLIDAKTHFGATVPACLLWLRTGPGAPSTSAPVYPDLSSKKPLCTMGLVGNELVADVAEYQKWRDVDGYSPYAWRSGTKHDAAAIMEFHLDGNVLKNGKGEPCDLESTYLFPLLKSSDLAHGRINAQRQILITQRHPADDTGKIVHDAPATWQYLQKHAAILDARKSSIYKDRPRFCMFGIGDYAFAPWKVAISGLYKSCKFTVVGSQQGKPTLLDDTCYFIPCNSHAEAHFVCDLLNSDTCQHFLRSLIFFDAKRPITVDLLNRIHLARVAKLEGRWPEAQDYFTNASRFENGNLLLVMEAPHPIPKLNIPDIK